MNSPAESARPGQKPRRRWQFSLRTALVLMLVIGAGLGLWARQERIRRNRLALIEKYEDVLEFESQFRDRNGRRLHALVFAGMAMWPGNQARTIVVASEDYIELATAAADKNGNYSQSYMEGAELEIHGNGDAILAIRGRNRPGVHFTSRFRLAADGVTAVGVQPNPELDRLDFRLALSRRINDLRIRHEQNPKVPLAFTLTQSRIGYHDGALKELTQLPELEEFDGSWMRPIGNQALVHLANLNELRGLNLNFTLVTDAGLAHLSNLRKLKRLELSGTAVTKKGVASLQAALPDCQIVF